MAKSTDYLYTWKIQNYSFCYHENGDELRSPFFQTELFGQNNWLMSLYPRGYDETSEGYVSIYLIRSDTKDKKKTVPIELDVKIEVLNTQNLILKCNEILNGSFEEGYKKGFGKFIEIDQLVEKIVNCADILTIKCHIMNKESTQQITECEAQTKIGVDRQTFEWECKIKDNYHFSEKREISLSKTSSFEINVLNNNNSLSVKITKKLEEVPRNKTSQLVTLRMSFLNRLGNEKVSKLDKYLFTFTNKTWIFDFIQEAELIAEKDNLLIDEKLVLKLELSTSNGIITSCISKFNRFSRLENALPDGFSALYKDKKYCDVKLNVDNETFMAHRSILASRSPVFSAMFDHDTVESQTSVVDILDVDAKIITLFLEFIYTGTVREMDYESALKLLVVSDKYDVQSLKEESSSFLMSALCVENVCEVLHIADLVSHTLLKEAASAYIQANASLILPSLKWTDLIKKNFKLAADIFLMLSIDKLRRCS